LSVSGFHSPSRKEYLLKQKEVYGRHLFGVFPAHYPRELFWAMNILPVEIWDPPLDLSYAGAHLQSYICSIVRFGLEFIVQGKADILDGFLFPHTCDSLQNLSSMVNDYLKPGKPCYFFYPPKWPYRESSHRFYIEQLRELAARLENRFGELDYGRFKQCIEKSEKVASVMRELYFLRSSGGLCASNLEFYRTIRQAEFLHPDDLVLLLERFLENSRGTQDSQTSVIMSGVLPNPPEVLALLDELKVRVGDDDLLACGRRYLVRPSQAEDPFEALAERFFQMPPCTTRNSPIRERVEHLISKVKGSNAKGVIFWIVKFCEPELFDMPHLIEALKEKGLPALVIDVEPNQELTGQLTTRIEAFVEMIS
jgi:benzoyl-CoA reductase/2-hydroxyglutaryl-CoA dehydratase subunit BcrC/BadD/HgdB